MKKNRTYGLMENIGLLKIIKMMRFTIFILFLSLSQTFAVNSYSQQTKLSLDMRNARVEDVLDRIEKNSDFFFMYNKGMVDVERKIDIQVEEKNVIEVLNKIFANTDVSYSIKDRQILLINNHMAGTGNESIIQQQQKSISGKVTDSSGTSLPGVSVVVKGTASGTITDANGNYSLSNVPANATLVFSFVGMRTQELVVGSQTSINVVMEEETIGIEEVVAVGYGTQKKINLTGAVDVITNEKLANRQAPTVSQLLQGLAPGLDFSAGITGFEPGASLNIDIRGIGSLNGGTPYVVIDGMPGNMDNLNPEDIESISILKDAAASAIYGSRAPYGVILITTKSGKRNEEVSFSYSGNMFLNTPQKLPEMLDSYTHTRILNEAGDNAGGRKFAPAQMDRIIAYQNEDWNYLKQSMPDWPEGATVFGAYPSKNTWAGDSDYANVDWWDVFYKDYTVNQKHDLSVKGGTNNSSYYFSAGYLEQDGVIEFITDNYKAINLMGKIDIAIADWWDFSWESRINSQTRKKTTQNQNIDAGYSGTLSNFVTRAYPFRAVYDGWGNLKDVPIFMRDYGVNIEDGIDTWNKFRMFIRPLKGWEIHADLGYNYYSVKGSNQNNVIYTHSVDNNLSALAFTFPSRLNRTHGDNRYWTTNIYSSYDFNIQESHNFKIMVGSQYEKGNYSSLTSSKTDLITSKVTSLQTATGDVISWENLSHRATLGFFSRVTYNYNEKYLLESNLRYDGSYVFREGNRWGLFPSLALGWNAHLEPFWENISPYINTLKMRVSWGQLGNQQVSPYSDIELIPLQTGYLNWLFNYGGTPQVGYTTTPGLVNKNLTWETATTKNLGMNASFLKNRLQADFDIYERLTTDMIGPTEAKPGVLGAALPRSNNSTLRTRGWELSLRWTQVLSNEISYFLNANLFDYKSVVTKYTNPTGSLTTWYNGKEVGEIWGYTAYDLFRTEEELTGYLATTDLSYIAAQNLWNTGDVKYEDTNNDGKVNKGANTIYDFGDLSIIGNESPRYQFGLSAGMSYKGFDFAMLWKGMAKRQFYIQKGGTLFWGWHHNWWEANLTPDHLDYFRDQPGTTYSGLYEGDTNINTDAYWPRPYLNPAQWDKNTQHANSRYLTDASYIRLQNIQLGYNFPPSVKSILNLQKFRIFVSGENLITFSKLPVGMDPVATYSLARQGSSLGRLTYGADRIYSVGLSITY